MRRIYITAILTCMILGGFYRVVAAPNPELISYKTTVDCGETIWDACARIASNEDDLREVVYRAENENGIDDPASVMPGTEIIVRVKPIKKG